MALLLTLSIYVSPSMHPCATRLPTASNTSCCEPLSRTYITQKYHCLVVCIYARLALSYICISVSPYRKWTTASTHEIPPSLAEPNRCTRCYSAISVISCTTSYKYYIVTTTILHALRAQHPLGWPCRVEAGNKRKCCPSLEPALICIDKYCCNTTRRSRKLNTQVCVVMQIVFHNSIRFRPCHLAWSHQECFHSLSSQLEIWPFDFLYFVLRVPPGHD